jgi:hypothetical protein
MDQLSFMKYLKKLIPAQVEFAKEAGSLSTLEGDVAYFPGDALMTGVKGEHWPIRRARFEATYEPMPPTRMGENGVYLKTPMPVTARQAYSEEKVSLPDTQGILKARAGDWILTSEDGHQWVVADDIFRDSYHPIE